MAKRILIEPIGEGPKYVTEEEAGRILFSRNYNFAFVPEDRDGIKYKKMSAGVWSVEETSRETVGDDAKEPVKNQGEDSQNKKRNIVEIGKKFGVIPYLPGKDVFITSLMGLSQANIPESSIIGLGRPWKDKFGAGVRSVLDKATKSVISALSSSINIQEATEKSREENKRLRLLSYMDRKIESPALITVLRKLDDKSEVEADVSRARELLQNRRNLSSEEITRAEEDIQKALNQEEVVYQTDRFFLENVTRPNSEKFQVVETFGEPAIIFYDKRIRIYSFSGTLPNMKNVYWRDEFFDAYNKYLRGTMVAENNYRVLLNFDDIMLEGALLQLQINQNAPDFASTTMQFNMYVKSETILSLDKIRISNINADINPDTGV